MRRARAFTLVEVLIVVVILGIIAAVALPRFSKATDTARANTLADNLRIFRAQVAVFKGQHREIPPGYPNCDPGLAPTEATCMAHMTQASNAAGQTAAPGAPGFPYGPYFREMPENPVNGKSTVQMIPNGAPFPGAGDDSHGWVYQPSTMTIKADTIGTDKTGKSYFDY